jgi:ATP-dependent protease ClpP protease subunit
MVTTRWLSPSNSSTSSQANVFNAKKKTSDVGELYFYGDIGDFFFDGISPTAVASALKDMPEAKELHIRINSPGGSVFDGIAIYNLLHNHPARKVVHIDSLAASIASYIAMVGNERIMASNAQLMIHKAWTFMAGNADDLAAAASQLKELDTTLVDMYAARTKLPRKEIEDMLAAETWMKAGVAKSKGFVNTIEDMESEPVDSMSRVLSKFKNTPKDLVAKCSESRVLVAKMQKRVLKNRASSGVNQ